MTLASLLLGVGLLLVGIYVIGQPWWRRPAEVLAETASETHHLNPLSNLETQRDAAYTALTELELDHQVGKVNDDDYAAVRSQLLAEAVQTLQQIDAVGSEVEHEIRRVARQRRSGNRHATSVRPQELGDVTCPACGKHLAADARFCLGCGTSLRQTCPACGRAVRNGDLFCGGCGHALASTAGV